MVVSGELSMTRVFPVVAAVFELDGELEPDLEHAPSPTASKQAAAVAKSHLILCSLLISLVFLSGFHRLWAMWLSPPHVTRRRAPVRRRPGASRPRPACPRSASEPGPPVGIGHQRTGTWD